jgi:hypothetical protein
VGTAVAIQGGPELRRALHELGVDLRDLSALHREIARTVVSAVDGTAPHDTGRLAGSFRPSGTRTTAKARSSLVYAPVQNYGWPHHNIVGRHYAERALSASTGKIESQYRAGVDRLLRKAES